MLEEMPIKIFSYFPAGKLPGIPHFLERSRTSSSRCDFTLTGWGSGNSIQCREKLAINSINEEKLGGKKRKPRSKEHKAATPKERRINGDK